MILRTIYTFLVFCIATTIFADELKTQTGSENIRTATLAGSSHGTAGELLRLHNEKRKEHGRQPLRLNFRLSLAAQKYAEYLSTNEKFEHNADGRSAGKRIEAEGYKWGAWNENLAKGMRRPAKAVDGWMKSEGHRESILSDQVEVGFGVFEDVWVAVFATNLNDYIKKKRKQAELRRQREAQTSQGTDERTNQQPK